MNFYVEDTGDPNTGDPNNKRYYIHSWVNNPTTSQGTGNADYLGVEPLMDTDQRIFLTDPKKVILSIMPIWLVVSTQYLLWVS